MESKSQSQSYPAVAFHPGLPSGRAGGKLSTGNDGVRFEWAGGAFDLEWGGLEVRRGGHDGAQIFLEHRAHAGVSITCSDSRLIEDPRLRERVEFRRELAAAGLMRRRWPAAVWLLVLLVALVAGALALLWWQKDALVERITNQVPVSWEIELGNLVFSRIEAEGKLITNSAYAERIRVIQERLLPVVRDSGYPFRFHVARDTNINAFALPGGHVIINTGLFEAARRPEEIAGVVAHELAHVTRRHGVRNIIESAGAYLLVQAMFGDVQGLQGVLVEGSRTLLLQKYSRDFEREADATGWEYLVAARIDPTGLADFFGLLRDKVEGAGGVAGPMTLLSTHPATEERLRALREKWEALPGKAGFEPLPSF